MAGEGIDEQALLDFLCSHLPGPGGISYRQEMEGTLDSSAIQAHQDLL